MKNSQEDLGYWAGWFVAFAIGAVFFICAAFQGVTLRGLACKSAEEDCFRQWVSALGGWAAVGAAVPTIFFLSRQISDANRHQQETMRVQLAKTRAIARVAEIEGFLISNFGAIGAKIWEEANSSREKLSLEEMRIELGTTIEKKTIATFRSFEQEIGTETGFLIDDIIARIDDYNKEFGTPTGLRTYAANAKWAEHTYKMIEDYGDNIFKAAGKYLKDTNKLMGKE